MPEINSLLDAELTIDYRKNIFYMLIIGLVAGLIAGLYPSIYLASFHPIKVFASNTSRGNKSVGIIRRILVVVQYVFTIILLIATIVILYQLHYINKKELGFNKEHILRVRTGESPSISKEFYFRSKLQNLSGIENVSLSNSTPGGITITENVKPDGYEDFIPINSFVVDENYIPGYNIQILAGKNFQADQSNDSTELIINESAMKQIGWTIDSTINRKMEFLARDNTIIQGKVICVINDYNYSSLHQKVEPLVIMKLHPHTRNNLQRVIFSVKVQPESAKNSIAAIEDLYNVDYSTNPFEYSWVNNDIERLYEDEARLKTIIWYFTFLIIAIACLGLYGLSSFTTEKRFKEIGIRKTFGEPLMSIVVRLSKEIVFLILIANIIAIPLGWYVMKKWLENFAYQVRIEWWIFALAALVSLFIALLTISYRSFSAASRNPVDALNYE